MSNILRAMSDGTSYNIIVKLLLSYDAGVPVGGHGKVASQTEDVRGSCVFIYPICTYITTYKTINAKLIGWGAQPIRAYLYRIESVRVRVRVRVIIEVREG